MSVWPKVALTDVCDIEGGTQPPKETFRYEETSGYVRMLQIQDFNTEDKAVYIPGNVRMKQCTKEDILIARYGASLGRILRGKAGAYNVALVKTVPDEQRLARPFLFHLLSGYRFQNFLANVGGRAAQSGFNKADLDRFEFPLPPLPEQKRIAEILDRAEALRAKRRVALAQVGTLTQSIFLDLFGDPRRNKMGHPIVRLNGLRKEGDTINYGVVQPGDDVEDGVPLIRVGDLVDGIQVGNLKRISPIIEQAYRRSRLRGDEILVSCVGSIGVVALATPEISGFNIARAVARIPLNENANRDFIAAYLRTSFVQDYFINELRTVSQPTLNIKQIAETPVLLPPIDLQHEFARRAAAVEKLKAAHRKSLAELDALFASLQHRAFRGEL